MFYSCAHMATVGVKGLTGPYRSGFRIRLCRLDIAGAGFAKLTP